MWVHMQETRRGSEDGFVVQLFHRGYKYDMADYEARRFIARGWAVAYDDFILFDKNNTGE
jgi:hypothetical protein